jgi:hypothetical protein
MKDRNWKTTLLGLGEAIFIELTAEALFDLTWQQRVLVVSFAMLRATFGYFARDRHPEDPPK